MSMLTLTAQFEPNWEQLEDYPFPVYSPYSMVVDERVFAGGGITESIPFTFASEFHEYVPATDTWVPRAPLPGPERYGARGFGLAGRGYVCLGWSEGTPLSDLWAYDPASDSWTEKAPFPGDPRYTAISVATSTKGYVGLGYAPYQNDWWEYDPVADSWSMLSPFPGVERQSAVSFVVDDQVYVGLGANDALDASFNDLYRYDPATDTWTPMADLPGAPRYTAYSFAFEGRGIVVCGLVLSGGTYTASSEVWSYDPANDAWTLHGDFPGAPRGEGAYCWSSNFGYMGMGRWSFASGLLSDNITAEFWRMRPVVNAVPDAGASTALQVTQDGSGLVIDPGTAGPLPLSIVDAAGRAVHRSTILGGRSTRLDVSGWSAGIYLVQAGTAPGRRIAIAQADLR